MQRVENKFAVREACLTVGQVLREGTAALCRAHIECAWLDAEVLLRKALGWPKARLYANLASPLDGGKRAIFVDLIRRRRLGEPTAYITGGREFWSLDFTVTPDVLIPRPETEHLVEATLELLERADGITEVLEVGTGSGAVAVSLAKERSDVEVWATDISDRALEIARLNAARHGVEDRIHFCRGDLFAALEAAPRFFRGVVSNPPYLGSESMGRLPREVREWEPETALFGGSDGLGFYRRLLAGAYRHMEPGGFLACEISPEIGREVRRLFGKDPRYGTAVIGKDHAGRDRVIWTRSGKERAAQRAGNSRVE